MKKETSKTNSIDKEIYNEEEEIQENDNPLKWNTV